ncbi:MAG: hypothetical protein AUG08_13485 [Acidobacteria bacterium 13_1_20CM_2_55_15]|nr:MAG: hypothetical protein AUG08_13485 [Acidobacteria bacterium 13_1_20CM_2_55_15]
MLPNGFFFSFLLLSFAGFLFLLGLLLVVDGITRLLREVFKKPRLRSVGASKISSAKINAADRTA